MGGLDWLVLGWLVCVVVGGCGVVEVGRWSLFVGLYEC